MQLVRWLSSKGPLVCCCGDEAYNLCLFLWTELSATLNGSDAVVPNRTEELVTMRGHETVVRLALLADFYKFQEKTLEFNASESAARVSELRAVAFKLLSAEGPCLITSDNGPVPERQNPAEPAAIIPRSEAKSRGCEVTARKLGAEPKPSKKKGLACRQSRKREIAVKWSRLAFSVVRKSYHSKLVRAFQMVKAVGHPLLTLNSGWELSCYFKLAVCYTTDSPLELAASCIPELRDVLTVIHSEQFHVLRTLSPKVQMFLYGVLNCHINWVDHNHKQILVVPRSTDSSRLPAEIGGDLRCSRCLKNQTFHSSEVKGNPRNIDVEFDLESMSFGSSCCSAAMINVPLSTETANTCTFTEMKQMYTACPKCAQPIFSEVLVDIEMLYTRCVTCCNDRINNRL